MEVTRSGQPVTRAGLPSPGRGDGRDPIWDRTRWGGGGEIVGGARTGTVGNDADDGDAG